MSDPKTRMVEDRTLRAASKKLLDTDWRLMKQDLGPRRLGMRLSGSASEKFRAASDEASAFARDNRGVIGGGIAAVLAVASLGLVAYRRLGATAASDAADED